VETKSLSLGQKIKRYRLVNDIRQEDMAEKLEVSRATLINYEKGHTSINLDVLNRLRVHYPDFEKEKDDIDYVGNYYLFKLLGERPYLKNAFDQVMKDKSDLEPEVAEKYINYPIVKEIIKEWEMNI